MATNPPSHSLPLVETFVEVLPVPPQQDRRRGVVRFVGLTDFADGEWVGVELVGSEGRNDGSVRGQSYFKCLPGQGVFVRPNLVIPYGSQQAETKDKAPDPSLTKIADLESQLAAAQQQASASAAEQTDLKRKLHLLEEELVSVRAAAEAQRAADEDTDFVAQVKAEEERLELQRQLEACQLAQKAAQASASAAADALTATEARAKAAALAAEQQHEATRAQLQAQNEALRADVANAQVRLTSATAENARLQAQLAEAEAKRTPSPQPERSPQPPVEDPALAAEVEALRAELRDKLTELQQLRTTCESLTLAQADAARERGEQLARLTAAEARATAAERRVTEVQSEHREDTAEANTAHAATVADLRAELAAVQAATAQRESSQQAALQAIEERCAREKEAALRTRGDEAAAALAAVQHEKAELQELCQLLEEELKEEKSQSDELAHLVEQLGAAKADAEAAVASVEQQTVQERDRLRREVAEARAREVRLMTAAEDAQRERDAALQRLAAHADARPSSPQNHGAELAAAESSHKTSVTETADSAAQAAELAKCRNELDEAQARIFQLSSTAQVAQELQQRCDELTRTLQQHRREAAERLDETQADARAAQMKSAAEVALWKRQCTTAQHHASDLANTVAALQRRWEQESAVDTAANGKRAAPPTCTLDAARERQYEARVAHLTRQLLELQAARMTAICNTLTWSGKEPTGTPCRADDATWSASRPFVKILDFSTPEACKASTQSLFRVAH